MFTGKELTTLTPLILFAHINDLDLQRFSPDLHPDQSDMTNPDLMDKVWRPIGKDYANDKQNWIDGWAEFLVKQYKNKKNKDKILNTYFDKLNEKQNGNKK